MAVMGKQRKPVLLVIEGIAGVLIWVMNTYRLVTGLHSMAFLEAACAGMIFLFGPLLIWETVQRLR